MTRCRGLGGVACAAVFFTSGLFFVDRAGLQTDEALFAGPLFRSWRFFSVSVGKYNIPVMNMSYIGALKTWLYAPVLLIFDPSPAVIRFPVILIGAVTIVIFWRFMLRIHIVRARWIVCVLLATG